MEAYSSISKDRLSDHLSNIVQKKMSLAVGYASRASIYDAVLTAYELSTAQCIVLALLHGLVNNDVATCSLLGMVSSSVQHLRSSHLKQWLKEDFCFEPEEIYRAFSTATHYINAGLINVPIHVMQILASICGMYNVVETCKEQGDKDTLRLLESLGVDIGVKSTSKDEDPAVTAAVFREDENSQSVEIEVVQEEPSSSGQFRENENSQSMKIEVVQKEPSSSGQVENTENPVCNEMPGPPPSEDEVFIPPFQNSLSGNEDEYHAGSNDEDSDHDEDNFLTSNGLAVTLTDSQPVEIEAIRQRGNIIEENGATLMHRAAENGSVRAIKLLLRIGVNVDSLDRWNRTPAHIAAIYGKLQALRALYHYGGADLMVRDNRGDTMLHSAACYGHCDIVGWLLQHGINVDVSGRGGWRPLHRAAQQGLLNTVRLLLDRGAYVDIMAEIGGTPLHRATWWNRLEVVHLLIAHGANIDAIDNRRDTALHLAAKLGHQDMVKLLLDCGADPGIEDRFFMTPYDWAERNNRTQVADFMFSRGAGY